MALDELLARVAHQQDHLRLLSPTRVLALEEMAKESLLDPHAVIGVELGPVLDTVHLEPLVV